MQKRSNPLSSLLLVAVGAILALIASPLLSRTSPPARKEVESSGQFGVAIDSKKDLAIVVGNGKISVWKVPLYGDPSLTGTTTLP